jgi:[acyl-carrier-protein] S-malonyltransferase
MERMASDGVTTAVEVGPGAVLSGLIKRSCPGIGTAQIAGTADLGF